MTIRDRLDQLAEDVWPFVTGGGGGMGQPDAKNAVVALSFTNDMGERIRYQFDAATFQLKIIEGTAARVELEATGHSLVRL